MLHPISFLRKLRSLPARIERLEEQAENLERRCYYLSLPESRYPEELKRWYFKRTGKKLDLDNPKTYNEKIQWFKLYGVTDLITKLADKYEVREYVSSIIGQDYLVPLLGVWDYPEEIDFSALPDKFVLKANHGCGYNYIVTDKNKLDKDSLIKLANKWLSEDYALKYAFEMQYHNIRRRIIAEAYIENGNNDLYDYKVWCFNGKAEYIMFLSNRKHGLTMDFYDRNWNHLDMTYNYPNSKVSIPKPKNLDELLDCAEKLAKGFPHVRVDFYRLNDGKIYFGEMTFTSYSGVCAWNPPEVDFELGRKFDYRDY